MTNDRISQIKGIGVFKWDKEVYVCPCKTIDIFGDVCDETLIILTNNRTKVRIDEPTEKCLSIDDISTIEKSKYALDNADILRTFDRFEFGIGKYEKVRVKDPIRNIMVDIDPTKIGDHFFFNTRPTKKRIVFASLDETVM